MPAQNLAKTIGVKVVAATEGEYVRVRNLTRGGTLTGALQGSDKSIVFNPAPTLQWQDGDLIQAEIEGSVAGVKQEKIEKGGAIIKISAAADTSLPEVSL